MSRMRKCDANFADLLSASNAATSPASGHSSQYASTCSSDGAKPACVKGSRSPASAFARTALSSFFTVVTMPMSA